MSNAYTNAPKTLIGITIGNYKVVEKLGEGGMGAVYLAEHPLIGKKVALKVLHEEFTANEDLVTRFFNEAKAVNDIGHPNIVDITDFGRFDRPEGGGFVYFIMEYLEGKSLADVISSEGAMDATRALHIARQVADALTASHAKGIIHRDLKPDNIVLVARPGQRDFAKVLDFGIAKLTGDGPGSRRTRTGIVMGTPAYMSPEQCEGKGNIDHRTDIYALGVVMFEMLTGRVPFEGEGYGEILVQHLTQPPPKLRSLVASIPVQVESVVLRALQKKPEERFESMQAFVDGLDDPDQVKRPLTGPAPAAPRPPGGVAPAVSRPTTLSSATGEHATVRLPSSPMPKIIGAVVAAAAIAGVLFMVSRGGDEPAAATAAASASPQAAAAAAAPTEPPAPAPSAAASITISATSVPSGAEVWVQGESAARGATPVDIELPKGDASVTLSFRHDGYQTRERSVRATKDIALEVLLEKEAAPAVAKNRPGKRPAAEKHVEKSPKKSGGDLLEPKLKKKKSCSEDSSQPGCGDNMLEPSF